MQCRDPFSDVTKNYLGRFYEILDTMTEEMTGAALADSVSQNFIVQMIPHHRAAIEMSQNILRYTTLVPLQHIAQKIVAEQEESIEAMQRILPQCEEQTNSRLDLCLYRKEFDTIAQTMFSRMRRACSTNQIDADFMREMIPHHKGAIAMSENLLHFTICPQLAPIARAIIVSQEKGVREMERLLCCVEPRSSRCGGLRS